MCFAFLASRTGAYAMSGPFEIRAQKMSDPATSILTFLKDEKPNQLYCHGNDGWSPELDIETLFGSGDGAEVNQARLTTHLQSPFSAIQAPHIGPTTGPSKGARV